MNKLALQANVCYNRGLNIVVLGGTGNTPSRLHLDWRCNVNTVSPHAHEGNTPLRQCKNCPEGQQWHPATLEYFPPEKKGKYGLSSCCRVCTRAKQNRHRSKPERHERFLAYMNEYHDRPEVQEKQRAYNRLSETKERTRAYRNEYRSRPETKAERRAYQQEYLNLPHVQIHKREWSQEYWKHPRTRALYQAYRQRRRASLRAAEGSYTHEQIQEQYERQKGRCYYCHEKVALNAFHVYHVIPLSRGGSNDISNIVVSCATCNLSKHNKLPHEFFQGGRLL